MNRKRVIFVGSSRWGLNALKVLTQLDGLDVVGALTNPANFKISYRPDGVKNVHHADVPSFCNQSGIPVYLMGSDESMKSAALQDALKAWMPDFFFVLGWYHMIPKTIRDIAPVLGVHYSLLPDYAGGAPLVWALINQEQTVGATLFQMDAGVDSGPIVGQTEVVVRHRETIGDLYERVGHASLDMLKTELPRFARGEIKPRPQENIGRRVFAQRGPEDGEIDWTQTAVEVDAFIRAQTRPYPGAFFRHNDRVITIWSGHPTPADTAVLPGGIKSDESGVYIGCLDGCIRLEQIAVDGIDVEASQLGKILK